MDRRECTRTIFRSVATLTADDISAAGEVADLSMSGMFVAADQPIPAGTDLDAEIRLTGSSTSLAIRCAARVVRCNDNGLAVSFGEMDLDSFVHLRNVISYASGDPDRFAEEYKSYVRRHLIDSA